MCMTCVSAITILFTKLKVYIIPLGFNNDFVFRILHMTISMQSIIATFNQLALYDKYK